MSVLTRIRCNLLASYFTRTCSYTCFAHVVVNLSSASQIFEMFDLFLFLLNNARFLRRPEFYPSAATFETLVEWVQQISAISVLLSQPTLYAIYLCKRPRVDIQTRRPKNVLSQRSPIALYSNAPLVVKAATGLEITVIQAVNEQNVSPQKKQ